LQPVARPARRSALFLDFDGTLAPIVADPAAARPLPAVPHLLNRLQTCIDLVAVVSGRPVDFLTTVLGPLDGIHLAGLYGLEARGEDGVVRMVDEVVPWRPVVAEVTRRALAEAPDGLGVEPKGLTVTLHWRGRPELADWAEAFVARTRAVTGLQAQAGRMALELRPPVSADKGTVVSRLAPGHDAVACFGDDLGDLPAFRALDTLARHGVAVARVAVTDAETPAEVLEAADVVVAGPGAAVTLLQQVADEAAAATAPGGAAGERSPGGEPAR
jgi:trehalose 6-phosphate phosphatase